jgi:hypothetical protein
MIIMKKKIGMLLMMILPNSLMFLFRVEIYDTGHSF